MAEETIMTTGTRGAADGMKELFVSRGTCHQVGANRPVELCDDTAWYVLEGTLDVFFQQLTDHIYGKRHLLCSAGEGALVWLGGKPDVPVG
jgi:hypothetical protein